MMGNDVYLKSMVLIRFLSASIEFTGAFLMWRYQRLDVAVRIMMGHGVRRRRRFCAF
ncbi:DUF2619 domain-containing protein [Sulfobacillus thermotolerans]|uniref:DUF2619 domain-containing protein n=1 Tax=Sulfobacillus thermotolerans TaxID=338644 RepID=UPI0033674568